MKKNFGAYESVVFINSEKEKEWEDLPEDIKTHIIKNLQDTCSRLENRLAIETLCHVVNGLVERIEKLESYIPGLKPMEDV